MERKPLLLLLLLSCGWSRADPMLSAVLRAGAAPAAVCAARGEAGCAGARWARYWLLARASCLARAPVARAPVLLDSSPEACRHIDPDNLPPGSIEALVHFIHPGYGPPPSDEWAESGEPDPLDAAFVLLSAPAPPTQADNHTATAALLPELSSWLRYVPAQVPWTRADAPPPTRRAERSPLLASPLRMLLSTIVAPVLALLATFLLLLRWPQAEPDVEHTDEKILVEGDALCGEAA